MFGLRRWQDQQERAELSLRLAEVSADIDRRERLVIDLRDRSAALRAAIDAEASIRERAVQFARASR